MWFPEIECWAYLEEYDFAFRDAVLRTSKFTGVAVEMPSQYGRWPRWVEKEDRCPEYIKWRLER